MALDFDPSLLTGDETIDGQHRELFARVGALLDVSREGRSAEEIVRLMAYLREYAIEHFGAEDRIMEATQYPRVEEHRALHADFVKDLEKLEADLRATGPTHRFVIRVGAHVTKWLRDHLHGTDRLLVEWLRSGASGGELEDP